MNNFISSLQHDNSWLFAPSAVPLGALHGLEPGHAKTMLAAFIVAIRGTLAQAVLLGPSATVSHTAIVSWRTWRHRARRPALLRLRMQAAQE